MDFDFVSPNEDSILWRYDYTTKSFYHKDTGEKLAFRFDPDTEIFTASKGVDIKINAIGKYVLGEFQQNYRIQHEPLIPQRKVDIGDGKFILESNENDMRWKIEYDRYTTQASLALVRFLIVYSVEVSVPNDIEARLKRIAQKLGEKTDDEEWELEGKIYAYVRDAIGSDEQEMAAFFDCLLGRNMITKLAMKRSEERFQNNSSGTESANVSTANR